MPDTFDIDHAEGLLGRLPAVSAKDHDFLLAALLPPEPLGDPSLAGFKYWPAPAALDQGRTSSCVGHGVHQLLKCSPIRNIKNIPLPIPIYKEAQLNDEFPGVDPQVLGTSLRAGVKVVQRLGYVESYHWCWDIETANRYILSTGPLLLGVEWFEGMLRTDKKGFIYPTGRSVGGHCVLEVGVNLIGKTPDGRTGFATILNHWGLKWGRKGRAKIALEDLSALLVGGGEAVAVQEILKAQQVTPQSTPDLIRDRQRQALIHPDAPVRPVVG